MKCDRIQELMSAYIDNEINEVDKAKFEKHIAQCPQCKEEYELLLDIVKECSDIDEEELPEDFREELHNKLLQAKESKSRGLSGLIRRNRWQVYTGAAAAAVLVFALSFGALNAPKMAEQVAQDSSYNSKSKSNTENYSMAGGAAPEQQQMGIAGMPSQPEAEIAPAAEPAAPQLTTTLANKGARNSDVTVQFGESIDNSDNLISGFTADMSVKKESSKIIKNGNVSMKVNDLQATIDQMSAMAEKLGGYVESSYVSDIENPVEIQTEKAKETATKVGNITIKVPADKFESTLQSILGMGDVVNQSTNSNDITKQYMDMEARMNNLKAQEKNYQELLSKAQNVDEMLRVETELNRIRTEIEIIQGDLKRWDDQVEYSTIYINLTEVKEAELESVDTSSVWQRARRGLINTINNIKNGIAWLFVFIISALPYIGILGAGTLLAVLWIKRKRKE